MTEASIPCPIEKVGDHPFLLPGDIVSIGESFGVVGRVSQKWLAPEQNVAGMRFGGGQEDLHWSTRPWPATAQPASYTVDWFKRDEASQKAHKLYEAWYHAHELRLVARGPAFLYRLNIMGTTK